MRPLPTLLAVLALPCAHAAAQELHWMESGFDAVQCDLSADMNGDGLADVIIGDDQAGVGGQVTVRSGKDGALLRTINGPVGERYGNSVVGLSDLNGDGFDEIGFGGKDIELMIYDGQTGLLLGSTSNGGPESRFASIGDVNGDGFDDIVVAEPNAGAGTVKVLSGRWFVDGTLPIALWIKPGTHVGGNYGADITSIADVTGDGIDDIVVGANEEEGLSGLFYYYGRIHCVSGATGVTLWTKKYYDNVDTRFGWSLSNIGDFNGDGKEDVAAGAPWNDANGVNAGAMFVLSGASGGYLEQIYFDQAGDQLGTDVAGVGDVDQDGTPDMLAGIPESSGALGGALLYSGASMTVIWESIGTGLEGSRGTLSGGVDASGDGVPDFVTGALGGTAGPSVVRVWRAECKGGSVAYCASLPNSTGQEATIEVLGPPSISGNAMTFDAYQCPPQVPGIFFYGTGAVQTPFGDGYLCLGGTITRFNTPAFTDDTGFATLTPNLLGDPLGTGPNSVEPGDTRYFQYWYRDPDKFGGTGFNLTNGQAITFCP